jgi:hypothetical protein
MKRPIKSIFAALLIVLLLIPSFAHAEGDYEEGDGWVYRDGELTITSNYGLINFLYHEEEMLADPKHKHTVEDVDRTVIGKDVTDIVIDYYIDGYHVSSTTVEEGNQSYIIDNGWIVNQKTNTLFGAANVKQNRLRSVINDLPTYIEHIGMYAFSECRALREITIPKGVLSIGESSFYRCDSMESVDLPLGTISIGITAFSGCTALIHIDIGDEINYIGAAAFNACFHLEPLPLYNTKVDTIYGNSFWGWDQLQSVEFPPTLRMVENQAFTKSDNLTSLIFNSDQLIIENGAFCYCENVRKLIFTKGKPTSIGDSLFGETEKTPDGKSFITRFYDPNGKTIPYPTLFYTAAYADEWAPNGETEWNGYPIEEISQDELNAILAEARGEPAPTPIATAAPLASNSSALAQKGTSTDHASLFGVLLAGLIALVGAAVAVVVVRIKKSWRKKATMQPEQDCGDHARDERNSHDRPEQ